MVRVSTVDCTNPESKSSPAIDSSLSLRLKTRWEKSMSIYKYEFRASAMMFVWTASKHETHSEEVQWPK